MHDADGAVARGPEIVEGPGGAGPRRPLRTCVACRASDGKDRLLRVVADPAGRLRIDVLRREPGRGAYVHPTGDCLRTALRKRDLWGRALRRNVVMSPAAIEAFEGLLSRLPGTARRENHGQRNTGNEES